MICYRDMTFCEDRRCTNFFCARHHSRTRDAGDIPVAWGDIWRSCTKRMADNPGDGTEDDYPEEVDEEETRV